jgi:hypothetical protein
MGEESTASSAPNTILPCVRPVIASSKHGNGCALAVVVHILPKLKTLRRGPDTDPCASQYHSVIMDVHVVAAWPHDPVPVPRASGLAAPLKPLLKVQCRNWRLVQVPPSVFACIFLMPCDLLPGAARPPAHIPSCHSPAQIGSMVKFVRRSKDWVSD